MEIASSASMKAIDGCAIDELGVDSCRLMENAARAVADAVWALLDGKPGRVGVFCGAGNNGGDGMACARFLKERGCEVRAFLCGKEEKCTADTREMTRRLEKAGGALEPFALDLAEEYAKSCAAVVDALFGTGLSRPLAGAAAEAVRIMDSCGAKVVSCDMPSGIGTDTGEILGCAVRADVTVTFSMAKPGQLVPPGVGYTGRLAVADIGIPEEAKRSQPILGRVTERDEVLRHFPPRPVTAHKGDFGKLLLLCGSRGMTGAAALAARAALRTGAGLVSLGVPESVYPILAAKLDEAMVFPLPDDGAGRLSDTAIPEILERLRASTACLVGPGLGRGEGAQRVVERIVSASRVPLVVDADGINALSGHMDVLRGAACPIVLTPHDGEFARLGGELSAGRFAAAAQLSDRTGAVVLLKGYRTIIAYGEHLRVNPTGNPGLATGGSGDVLSGVIVSLLGQGLLPYDAAWCGAYLHGAAADLAAGQLGQYGLLPSDVVEALPRLLP